MKEDWDFGHLYKKYVQKKTRERGRRRASFKLPRNMSIVAKVRAAKLDQELRDLAKRSQNNHAGLKLSLREQKSQAQLEERLGELRL